MKYHNFRFRLFLTIFVAMVMFWVKYQNFASEDNHSQLLMQNVEALTEGWESQNNTVCYGPMIDGCCLCLCAMYCTGECI